MVENCILCGIGAGKAPSHPVLDSSLAVAFLDINPAADGHTLVAPKAHVQDVFALEGEVAADVWRLTCAVARRLDYVLEPDGMTLFQANRSAGW
ncbi:MAG: HIT domain-containing protein [Actinomycetota bacterium]|nr:HIT domain-containing protein [Actinomycetota bacterium]